MFRRPRTHAASICSDELTARRWVNRPALKTASSETSEGDYPSCPFPLDTEKPPVRIHERGAGFRQARAQPIDNASIARQRIDCGLKIKYPYLSEFPIPSTLGYPQFPPSDAKRGQCGTGAARCVRTQDRYDEPSRRRGVGQVREGRPILVTAGRAPVRCAPEGRHPSRRVHPGRVGRAHRAASVATGRTSEMAILAMSSFQAIEALIQLVRPGDHPPHTARLHLAVDLAPIS